MRAVLISIQPKWVEMIASGEKTIEVRKTKPNLQTPFKVYIYQTRKPISVRFSGTGKHISEYDKTYCYNERSGKVLGEFVCDRIDELPCGVNQPYWLKEKTCISNEHYKDYLGNKDGYGWYISQLKIYDKPKELKEFTPICRFKGERCKICCFYEETFGGCCATLTRPPQSWCYAQELQE